MEFGILYVNIDDFGIWQFNVPMISQACPLPSFLPFVPPSFKKNTPKTSFSPGKKTLPRLGLVF